MDKIKLPEHDSTLEESIKEEMRRELPLNTTECSIYRVPRRLFKINPIAYTPQVISIGPFHHGREHLMAMERHKLQALDIFLRRINMSVEDIIAIDRNWERDARRCYAEPINMNHDHFVKMMLVDGCFLLEFMILLHYNFSPPPQILTLYGPFYEGMELHLCYDIIMLENQLPLFVLEDLFNQLRDCKDCAIEGISFMGLVQFFLECACRISHHSQIVCKRNAYHLVHLLSDYFRFLSDKDGRENSESEQKGSWIPPTLTELWEAGVTIKKVTKEKPWMDVSFKNGVLEISDIDINDQFEIRLRNLMAFEHYHSSISRSRYIINYVSFLDGLISTEKDASLLVNAEILTNCIGGSNEEVSKLFNDLCKGVTISSHNCYYYNMAKALRKHCKTMKNRWMASLRRDYFNTPWAAISFVAATFLILLTFIQTMYSHLSYLK